MVQDLQIMWKWRIYVKKRRISVSFKDKTECQRDHIE